MIDSLLNEIVGMIPQEAALSEGVVEVWAVSVAGACGAAMWLT